VTSSLAATSPSDLTRGSLRSYLAVVAYRRAVDEVRRHERRARTEAAAALPEADDGPEAGVVAAATESYTRLAALLERLPTDQRTAVQLAYYNGLTYTQVAKTLGIPEGTAKSQLRLALARLRSMLDDDMRAAIS
jgi:RNA polymerase sigma-70 factor, ECF subfamily